MAKGNSSQLMKKSSTRRKTKQEIKDIKRREEEEKQEIAEKLAEVDNLRSQIQKMSQQIDIASDLHDQMDGLMKSGVVK